jgi:protein SCO1/2
MDEKTAIRNAKIRYIAIVAIIILLAFKLSSAPSDKATPVSNSSAPVITGEANIGGAFTLVNQDKRTVKDSDLRGKYMLVYFGFTHCPDVCPTDMALISNVMENLGNDAKKIQPIFMSVDPERDTPAELKTYLSNFYPGFMGLTGTLAQMAAVANEYHIFYQKVKSEKLNEYLMDHSAFIYLMGKDGKYITHFNGKQSSDEIAAKIKESL